MKTLKKYRTPSGREPFNEWFEKLDWKTQAKIDAYIVRATLGAQKKNVRALGEGIFEVKIDFGPGYRVYFGEKGKELLVLLLGGSKKTQEKDIAKARSYWGEHCEKNQNVQ